jgi:hypothetical protein
MFLAGDEELIMLLEFLQVRLIVGTEWWFFISRDHCNM